jgi:putative chitinase
MIEAAQFLAFAPHADPAFAPLIDEAAGAHDIATPLRVAHWLAQMAEETGYFRVFEEDLDYTSAARIAEVWPSRFTPASAARFVGNPEALANSVYAGRMGNGDAASGDGWRYRGRGALQTTGRDGYAQAAKIVGTDFVAEPDLLALPEHAFMSAAAFWQANGCNQLADADDIAAVTRRVNGGLTNLGLRVQILGRAKGVWKP